MGVTVTSVKTSGGFGGRFTYDFEKGLPTRRYPADMTDCD